MGNAITVRTYADYLAALAQFEHKLYRGQTKDYPGVIPSVFRRQPPIDTAPLLDPAKRLYFSAHRVDEIAAEVHRLDEVSHAQWVKLNEERARGGEPRGWFDRLVRWLFPKDEPSQSDPDPDTDGWWSIDLMNLPVGHGMGTGADWSEHVGLQWSYGLENNYHFALLQHYGAPSPVLDVAYDPAVALWFATHQLFMDKVAGTAWYKPAEVPGVVYVMNAPANRVVDLRQGKEVPIAGLRGQRQHGGLLIGATLQSPDLVDCVAARITIYPETFDSAHPDLARLSQTHLFPPPGVDEFYKVLLAARTSTDLGIRDLAAHIPDYIPAPAVT